MDTIAIFGDLLYDCFIWSDRLPRVGETVTGYASGFFASGKGGNQAMVCARLGARALMLGKVGRDERGDFVLATLEKNGVDTEGVLRDPENPTGTDCVMVAEGGQNLIVVAPNATAKITAAEVDAMRPFFERAGSALFQLQVNPDAVARAMRLAHDCGCAVILNPAPACEVPEELFALADYVTPNETEAEFFTGIRREGRSLEDWCAAAGEALHGKGVRRLIITLGEHGSYYSDGERRFVCPAFPVEAVDSTAAGDAFNGGLAVRLAAGDSLQEALRYASACGALTTTRRGSVTSLPDDAEARAFLAARTDGQTN